MRTAICSVAILTGLLCSLARLTAQVSNAAMLTRIKKVPVLCYHQVRERTSRDSKSAGVYIIPPSRFSEHLRILQENGYESILPDEFCAYLRTGVTMKKKQVMLCFDDGTAPQYDNALPELDRAGFKAVFFIMTVVLNKPRYLSTGQLRQLVQRGHSIGCHTWDHHDVRSYTDADWRIQLEQPLKTLCDAAGTAIRYFAYPFGAWNRDALPHLHKQGIVAAFQLWAPPDSTSPMLTIPRVLVDGNWTGAQLLAQIHARYPEP